MYQSIESNMGTYDKIRKIANGQWHGYKNGCLLNYPYYKLNAIDLKKKQK